MGEDEVGTLAALKAPPRDVVSPLIAQHHGRVVKVTGDGVLVEFASAVNAVQCAVEVQARYAAANATLPDDHRIVLRIGINLGDVIVEGSDLYGDGVNIAARLEALAEPGGICISARCIDQVRGKLDADLRRSRRPAAEEHRRAGARLHRVDGAARLRARPLRAARASRRSPCCPSPT